MIDVYPLLTPIVGRDRDGHDPYYSCDKEDEILGEQYPYLAAIGALLYLATSIRSNIVFVISVLARHNAYPIL